MNIDIAYSPCPNDTFLFDAWVNKKIPSSLTPRPLLADIQQLNSWAKEGRLPMTKVSAFCLGQICDEYVMLPVGAALSAHGPKLIAHTPFPLEELEKKKVAVPGLDTTAYLLFRALFGMDPEVVTCPYEQIIPLLLSKAVDAGVIIHETRFTFQRFGMHELADLGLLFSRDFGCLVPLGCLVAKRSLPHEVKEALVQTIKASLHFATQYPEQSRDYILQHAQEKDVETISQHIAAYVNNETMSLSQKGSHAFSTLLKLGSALTLLPKGSYEDSDFLCHL